MLGDQLSRRTGALARHGPGEARVVMVESRAKLAERPWHRHKLAYVLSAMRHFADELRDAGYEVDYRTADDLRDGLRDVDPADLVVMAPSRWRLRQAFAAWGVQQVPNDAFIVGEDAFAAWADGRKQLTMESFYRRVRADHGWLMDGDAARRVRPVPGRRRRRRTFPVALPAVGAAQPRAAASRRGL